MTKFFNLDNPAPFVSARSWIMTDLDSGEVMFAKREKEVRQVASLTKIMTFWVISDMLTTYGINPDGCRVKILEYCTTPQLGGTSAELLPGDTLNVTELLYGMMLPSGNDAAQNLAVYFGNLAMKLEQA